MLIFLSTPDFQQPTVSVVLYFLTWNLYKKLPSYILVKVKTNVRVGQWGIVPRYNDFRVGGSQPLLGFIQATSILNKIIYVLKYKILKYINLNWNISQIEYSINSIHFIDLTIYKWPNRSPLGRIKKWNIY